MSIVVTAVIKCEAGLALVAIVSTRVLIAMSAAPLTFYLTATNTVDLEVPPQVMVCMKSLRSIFWPIVDGPSS